MDIISHALIGKIICFFDKKSKNKSFLIIFFSIMPDFALIPFYAVLGKENERFFWIAQNQDPFLTSFYNATHSIFFACLIILPIVLFLKLPKLAFLAYLLHIAIDIFTHAGEWAIKIFYPLNFDINGFSNAWAWPISSMIILWAMLSAIILYLNKTSKET
jgi:membrane-bound metal-dependent hydrolase YbcI (DUF457 family)